MSDDTNINIGNVENRACIQTMRNTTALETDSSQTTVQTQDYQRRIDSLRRNNLKHSQAMKEIQEIPLRSRNIRIGILVSFSIVIFIFYKYLYHN